MSGRISHIKSDCVIKIIKAMIFVFNLIFLWNINNQEIHIKGDHFVIARNAKEINPLSFPISPDAALINGSVSALFINNAESNGPKGEPLLIHV